MHGTVAVVVEREVEPLLVGAHEAVGVIHAALQTIHGFLLEHALIWPSLHAVKTDPKRHWTAMLGIGIVQQRNLVASQTVEHCLGAGVGDRGLRREHRP